MAKKKMKRASRLVSKKLLSVEQAQKVMQEQEKQAGIRDKFGRIAVKMGSLCEAQLDRAVMAKEKDEALT